MNKYKCSRYTEAQLTALANASEKGADVADIIRGMKDNSSNWDDVAYEYLADVDSDYAAMADDILATIKPKKSIDQVGTKVREKARRKSAAAARSKSGVAAKVRGKAKANDQEPQYKWDDRITELIESKLDVTRSDAQAMLEAQSFYKSQAWGHGLSSDKAYEFIAEKAGWNKKDVENKKTSSTKNQGPLRGAAKDKADKREKREALIERTLLRKDLHELSEKQVLEIARQFNDLRMNVGRDETTVSKQRLSATPENLIRWMRNPGAFDLISIDSARATTPTADLKVKTATWWKRFGM